MHTFAADFRELEAFLGPMEPSDPFDWSQFRIETGDDIIRLQESMALADEQAGVLAKRRKLSPAERMAEKTAARKRDRMIAATGKQDGDEDDEDDEDLDIGDEDLSGLSEQEREDREAKRQLSKAANGGNRRGGSSSSNSEIDSILADEEDEQRRRRRARGSDDLDEEEGGSRGGGFKGGKDRKQSRFDVEVEKFVDEADDEDYFDPDDEHIRGA